MKIFQGGRGLVLKIIVSVALITILFAQIDPGDAWDKVVAVPPLWVSVALVLILVQAVTASMRWSRLGKATGVELDFGTALRLFFIGTFFNQTLPSSIGGDVVRVWMIRDRAPTVGVAVSNVLADRLFGFLGLILIAAAGLPMIFALLNRPAALGLAAVVLAGLALVGLFMMMGGRLGVGLARFRFLSPLHQTGATMIQALATPSSAFWVLALSVVTHVFLIFTYWALAQGMALDLSIAAIAALIPIASLVTMLPISMAGWGVREGALVVLLGMVDVPAADALVLSVLFGLVVAAGGLPGGLLWLATRRPREIGEQP